MHGSLVALALLIALSGCLAPQGPAPIERPTHWDTGVAMLAFNGFRAHSADESQSLVPNGTVATPAFCAAYQDARREARDTCFVLGPRPGHPGAGATTFGPWTIDATWDGRGEDLVETERNPDRRTVVAFDVGGEPIAWWAGARYPGTHMAIE